MLFNHITTAWRNLRHEKFYATLNILGLAAALTCAAFIATWVWDEWQRDRYFPHSDRLVRVVGKVSNDRESFDQAVTSVQVAPNMKNDYPEIEEYCRLDLNDAVVNINNQQILEPGLLTVDSTFLSMFQYKLKGGNPRTALTEPYTVVLTEKIAQKYFGDRDPIGQSFKISLYDKTGQGATYRVTGVLEGSPRPSHYDFGVLVSFASFFDYNPNYLGADGWDESGYYTYVLLRPGVQLATLQAKMPGFFQKYIQTRYGSNTRGALELQPLRDIYLHSDRRYEMADNGSASNLFIFGSVGLLILLIAGINYVNMATARAAKRARSVGVRKALGAQRGHLAAQFLVESVLATSISAILALGLGIWLQPAFEQMTDKPIGIFNLPYLSLGLTGVSLLLGLGAGAYPAFVLSGYQPVSVLKGSPDTTISKGIGLRQTLVVAQFAISIALIISVLVIRNQMDFIQHKNLGYQKEALLTLKVAPNPAVRDGIEAFRNDLTSNSALVHGMTFSNIIPVGGTGNSTAKTIDSAGKTIETSTDRIRVDLNYAAVMGLKFLAGRDFSSAFPTDMPTDTTQNYILNAAAVRSFGWETPDQAIGKPFRMHGRSGLVVGIVEDFHINSLKYKVAPLAIHLTTQSFSQVIVRVEMSRAKEAIAVVESKWKQHFPDAYMEYAFLDEKLARQYRSELRFGSLFGTFSLFSIFIACLGLFGLAAYTAERRTKEIGIRKVLGASVTSITSLLAQDFLKLVVIAIVIASPVAYYFMNKWLADFAYRIDMQWWMFAAAGAAAMGIAFLTVGGQAVRAALANPVKSLRSE